MTRQQILKLSALVKARILFADEIKIAEKAENKIFTEDFLQSLVTQKVNMIAQRDNMLKSFVILIFSVYLVSNGSSISIPGFGIQLSEIPGLLTLLILFVPVFSIMWSMSHISVQGYDALIDQIIIAKKSDFGIVDPDIIKAAYEPYHFSLKFFRKKFNLQEEDRFAISKVGRFSNLTAMVGINLVLLFCLFVPISYFLYAVAVGTVSNPLGWALRVYSYTGMLISVLILLLESFEFEHRVRTD